MVRKRYEIHVWGTVLFLDLGSSKVDEAAIDAAVEDVKKFVYGVDSNSLQCKIQKSIVVIIK